MIEAGRAVPHPLLRHPVREPERDEAPALRRGDAARRADARRARAVRAPGDRHLGVADERVDRHDQGDPRSLSRRSRLVVGGATDKQCRARPPCAGRCALPAPEVDHRDRRPLVADVAAIPRDRQPVVSGERDVVPAATVAVVRGPALVVGEDRRPAREQPGRHAVDRAWTSTPAVSRTRRAEGRRLDLGARSRADRLRVGAGDADQAVAEPARRYASTRSSLWRAAAPSRGRRRPRSRGRRPPSAGRRRSHTHAAGPNRP